MRKRIRNSKKKSGEERLFGFVTTVLSLILVILICVFIHAVMQSHDPYLADAEELLRTINSGNYESAISMVHENRANGVDETTDSDFIQPYAVVDYLQAELDYRMSIEAGESAKAASSKVRMNEAYKKMGDMQFKAKEIDRMIIGE
ncbi:MAG: hypothetical protein KBS68_00495 [Clostridiales bacterium]|nr:hypothetical protein [Candidatus Crickella merdequi]